MNIVKKRVISEILKNEGGYVNDPLDSGGETNYGITKKVAKEHGFLGDMRNMSQSFAESIYAAKYWDSVKGDDLAKASYRIAYEVADTGVNMGVSRSSKFLQTSLNVLNNKELLYSDLKVDGFIGMMTITALNDYLEKRDEVVLLKCLNCLQGAAYVELAERREKDEKFIYGWLKNSSY